MEPEVADTLCVPVSAQARRSFEKAWGITVTEQLEIESKVPTFEDLVAPFRREVAFFTWGKRVVSLGAQTKVHPRHGLKLF
jgi:hypothetical protein